MCRIRQPIVLENTICYNSFFSQQFLRSNWRNTSFKTNEQLLWCGERTTWARQQISVKSSLCHKLTTLKASPALRSPLMLFLCFECHCCLLYQVQLEKLAWHHHHATRKPHGMFSKFYYDAELYVSFIHCTICTVWGAILGTKYHGRFIIKLMKI